MSQGQRKIKVQATRLEEQSRLPLHDLVRLLARQAAAEHLANTSQNNNDNTRI